MNSHSFLFRTKFSLSTRFTALYITLFDTITHMKYQHMLIQEIVGRLVYNTVTSPSDLKFRRVRLANEKISAAIVKSGALEAMIRMGWVKQVCSESGEEVLVLPEKKYLSIKEYKLIQDVQEKLKKDMIDEARQAKLHAK